MSSRVKQKAGQSPHAEPAGAALWSRPGFLVRRLHQIHAAMFAEECGAFNITPVQYGLMTILLEQPGLDQISLASRMESHMKRAQERLMAPFGESDRATFLKLLGRLVDANNEWSRAPLRRD